jgi:hypothetical protein
MNLVGLLQGGGFVHLGPVEVVAKIEDAPEADRRASRRRRQDRMTGHVGFAYRTEEREHRIADRLDEPAAVGCEDRSGGALHTPNRQHLVDDAMDPGIQGEIGHIHAQDRGIDTEDAIKLSSELRFAAAIDGVVKQAREDHLPYAAWNPMIGAVVVASESDAAVVGRPEAKVWLMV